MWDTKWRPFVIPGAKAITYRCHLLSCSWWLHILTPPPDETDFSHSCFSSLALSPPPPISPREGGDVKLARPLVLGSLACSVTQWVYNHLLQGKSNTSNACVLHPRGTRPFWIQTTWGQFERLGYIFEPVTDSPLTSLLVGTIIMTRFMSEREKYTVFRVDSAR